MPSPRNPRPPKTGYITRDEDAFSDVVRLIAASREKAIQTVNAALIDLYWQVGAMISRKIEAAEWGDGVVDRLAQFIARTEPGLRGFTRRNLFRMRQFYEAYKEDSIVSPLVAQLPWSHQLIILGQSKRPEEREFYIRLAIKEKWSRRELERQFGASLFERAVLSPAKVSPLVTQIYPEALSVFRDAYTVEFLGLSPVHAEADLHRGLVPLSLST
jgi:predicted nuclease of restriction endonuclease-like (RecB) superfamily